MIVFRVDECGPHTISLQALPGVHLFCFVVDSVTKHSDYLPTTKLRDGTAVNYINVSTNASELYPEQASMQLALRASLLRDRPKALEYWLCLPEAERRMMIVQDQDMVLNQLTQFGCRCVDCLSERSAQPYRRLIFCAPKLWLQGITQGPNLAGNISSMPTTRRYPFVDTSAMPKLLSLQLSTTLFEKGSQV